MAKEKQIIRHVYYNKFSKQLLITIPLKQGIEAGDYVGVKKIKVG